MRTENEIFPLEIIIVGTGGLATSLYPALSQHHQVSLVSRNPLVARVRFPDATIYSFDQLPESADLIILAVPDDVLNEMVTLFIKIPPRIGIVQVSGAGQLNPDLLGNIPFGVWYPLQTFSRMRQIPINQIPILIDCTDEILKNVLQSITLSLHAQVIYCDAETRLKAHLGAVFANNFGNYLFGISSELACRAGLPEDLYQELLQETLAKFTVLGAEKAQTGPAIRGDEVSQKRHTELLHKWASEYLLLYQEFTRLIKNNHTHES
ncbi:MAG: DUF2520 domain-containing protein [Sphingobacteriia bacterium]|nr:DUF2520 domain-containing protein [Sphingobacteriia bacterium]